MFNFISDSMKKIMFLMMMLFMVPSMIIANSDEGVNHRRAGIMSEEFVKQRMANPKETKFEGNVKGETVSSSKFIVYQKFTTKNDYGVIKSYVYKVSMIYRGGDWTELKNWTYDYLIIEDLGTGKQYKYNSPKN